ncbi:hypothetical protein FOZ60_008294 [Perkinsus olseni]|uniref:ACT domain-containing protein n=1 Tax=Perkinsus olseni TaxID=32597 RepID=A0A7J6NJN8_PEROL|nr:hypothetical protein FOZ60_008294 [Perkinsus olseni]
MLSFARSNRVLAALSSRAVGGLFGAPGLRHMSSETATPYESVIVCVSGTNRVGFVRDLCSDCIHPVDGNLGRTRMAILGQDFSVIAEVNLQSGRVDELKQKLTDAFPDYLVGVKRTAGGSVGLQAAGAPRLQKQLRVCGPDERNILGRFCEYLAQKDIEILDLKSEVLSGSHIGYDVFDTTLTIGIPVGEDAATDHLQQELSRLGEEIGVEATLMPFP